MPPILFGAVSIILDMFNRKKLIKILKKFFIFDKEVRFLSGGPNYFFIQYFVKITDVKNWNFVQLRKETRHAFLCFMIPTLMTLPILTGVYYIRRDFLRSCCPRYLRTITCISVSMSYALFIRSLYIRFATLNSLLRSELHYYLSFF